MKYFYLFILISLSTLSFAADTDADRPEVLPVNRFHEILLNVMQNADSLGYSGRYDELSTIISSSFDLPLIAQVVLGRHWSQLNNDEKTEFISLYEKLIISTYASRFDAYGDEIFIFKAVEELNRGRKLIKTELHSDSSDVITLDYLMTQKNGVWKIISVIADGANDISIKRAEYADVIKLHGYPKLLDEIHLKITEMEGPK